MSFAFCLPHLNFLAHSRHKTTLTKADFLTPCSRYPNGISSSSNLASTRGVSESGSARGAMLASLVVKIEEEVSSACCWAATIEGEGSWYRHRREPHVRCPIPDRTSSSVRQRRATYRLRRCRKANLPRVSIRTRTGQASERASEKGGESEDGQLRICSA